MAGSYTRSREDLVSHDVVRQALLAGDYAVPRLPEIPVEKILDHAEYWKWVECSTNRYVGYTNGRYEYLRLSVPQPEVCKKVKKVEITCISKDHDWSSNKSIEHRISWACPLTWGDVSISVTSSEEVKEFPHERVFTNLHLIQQWQLHRCSFEENSDLVSSLVPGSSEIVLYLNARFPGWLNHAKSAAIKIMFV